MMIARQWLIKRRTQCSRAKFKQQNKLFIQWYRTSKMAERMEDRNEVYVAEDHSRCQKATAADATVHLK